MSSPISSSKEDILYFKDEILKDIKKFEIKLGQKIDIQVANTKNKLDEYEIKIATMVQKINNLANQISTNASLKEKVDEIYGFKAKVQQDKMVQEIRVDTIAKDLKDAINKYDAILSDSVLYPGVIGMGCKFPGFHDLIDFVLTSLNQLTLAKDKNVVDIKNMKKKYDNNFLNIKTQLESSNKDIKGVNKKVFDLFDEKVKILEEENVKKFVDVQMNNNKYAIELQNKADKLVESYKNVEKIRLDIEDKLKYEVDRVVNMPNEFNKKFSKIKEELNNIKIEFLELSDFVKNNKFETKSSEKGEDSKRGKNADKKINNKGDKFKIKKPKGVSLLKQYIKGEITFEKYNQQLKLQNSHLNEEEMKIEENTQNGLINNTNSEVVDNNQINIPDLLKIKEEEKKEYIMKPASEAGIIVRSNNSNFDFSINSDEFRIKNHIKKNLKVNVNNYDLNNMKRNSQEGELINNSNNEPIQKMIKIYNINHKKYKKVIEVKNQANNTSFQEPEIIRNKTDEADEKDLSQNRNNTANSSPQRIEEIIETKSIEKNQNRSFHLEERQYYPEINSLGVGLIEVINYNTKKAKEMKENRKGDILDFIKKSYDDQEIIDEKKLFQLKNAIEFSKGIKNNNINNNYNNNSDIFSNTLSHTFKKNLIRNIFKKETNLKKHAYERNFHNHSPSIGLPNDKRNSSNGLISLEKINKENINGRKIEIDTVKNISKKLNPIKLKGSSSSSNLRQKKLNEADLINKEEKKFGKLMNKIKDMIPYEEKISLFETSNIDNLNKNVFSKKNIFFEKKEKDDLKIKELAKKRLNAVYQNEPKHNNINNQVNLINNENFFN